MYAIGISDRDTAHVSSNCPCSKSPGRLLPSFVHDNYYCESGTMVSGSAFFTDDPVWYCEGCSDEN